MKTASSLNSSPLRTGILVLAIFALSFHGCDKFPPLNPGDPNQPADFLLSKVTVETINGDWRPIEKFQFEYNSFNKPAVIKYFYANRGDTSTSIDTLIYDAQQRLIGTTSGIAITYDENGRIKTVKNSDLYTFTYLSDRIVKSRRDYALDSMYPDFHHFRTFIHDQEGDLVRDTAFSPHLEAGVFLGYDTSITKYIQFDNHPSPINLTNINATLFIGTGFVPVIEPFVPLNNYQKTINTFIFKNDGHVEVTNNTYINEYNQAGLLVKRSNADYGTTVWQYEYIPVEN